MGVGEGWNEGRLPSGGDSPGEPGMLQECESGQRDPHGEQPEQEFGGVESMVCLENCH